MVVCAMYFMHYLERIIDNNTDSILALKICTGKIREYFLKNMDNKQVIRRGV